MCAVAPDNRVLPTVFDNIELTIAQGLRGRLAGAKSADFCVGYFNLRGWREIEAEVAQLSGGVGGAEGCRLLVGMARLPQEEVRRWYARDGEFEGRRDNKSAMRVKEAIVAEFARQLAYGVPAAADQEALMRLRAQIAEGAVRVRAYLRRPLHAKLYLVHREDAVAPAVAIVGSSNLTYSGLVKNDELNVDVLDQDAADKLTRWFEARWEDDFCVEVEEEVVAAIDASWASGSKPPYHIYVKSAWHLSREAVGEADLYALPPELGRALLEHQKQGVMLAAQRIRQRRGAILGDVVGLGKTLVATAVARVRQEVDGDNVLVICPPALEAQWRAHLERYRVAGRVLSLGQVGRLAEMRRYKLVIIDEAHNLRNRESRRHRAVRAYVRDNDSRVLLLTATPYNKAKTDLAGQLLLFLEGDERLGILPDNLVGQMGGVDRFCAAYPGTGVETLGAFEKSDWVDDWRELMRLFLVRRTRRHVKENFAEWDEMRGRRFLALPDGGRFYFPHRVPRRMSFAVGGGGNQYALLYTREVVDVLGALRLPRYGLQKYIDGEAAVAPDDEGIIANLNRSGERLRGFARIGLFKRLESSGVAFLISVRLHVARNAALLAALADGWVFVGATGGGYIDEAGEEEGREVGEVGDIGEEGGGWEALARWGEAVYARVRADAGRFLWLPARYFGAALAADLRADAVALWGVLGRVPRWEAAADGKLAALRKLCAETHADEKVLVFSQYVDTVAYLHGALGEVAGGVGLVHGESAAEELAASVRRFSPAANGGLLRGEEEMRVLLATDKLSEGVNLQDARIVVNYDLPWAIVRLVQRAGRVDRIGQRADTILCYSALPAAGVEEIIGLRRRLQARLAENCDLIGTDEVFFDAAREREARDLYDGRADLEELEEAGEAGEDDTDLVSFAYDVWRRAVGADPALARVIAAMPDVVYSAMAAAGGEAAGVIAYLRDGNGAHFLARLDAEGRVVTRSQYRILQAMACAPDTPALPAAAGHHDLVAEAVRQCRALGHRLGGQLGGGRSVRRLAHERLVAFLSEVSSLPGVGGWEGAGTLRQAVQLIYEYPLRDEAREKIRRHLRFGEDEGLARAVVGFYERGALCVGVGGAGEGEGVPVIVCSVGLVGGGGRGCVGCAAVRR